MADAWNDAALMETFDAALTLYQQIHGVTVTKSAASPAFEVPEKEDEERVDSHTTDSNPRVHDLGVEHPTTCTS